MEEPRRSDPDASHTGLCWACDYDLGGLSELVVCPECGASQLADALQQERARFRREGWAAVRRSAIVSGVAIFLATSALYFQMRSTGFRGPDRLIMVIGCAVAPFLVLGLGRWIWAGGSRRLTIMCAGRSVAWAVVPMAGGFVIGRIDNVFVIAAGFVIGLAAFVVRWNLLADRAGLPESHRTGLMTGALIAACLLIGFMPFMFAEGIRAIWP